MFQNTDNTPYIPRKPSGSDEGVDLSKLFHRPLKDGELAEPITYDEADVKTLQEFCRKHNILGVDFGNQNPKAILAMLKGKMGIADTTQEVKTESTKGLLNG
jgi:hypothetical protein